MSETQQQLKVTQEKLPASQLGLEIEIPAGMSQKAYEQVVHKFMRSADIPGFRRGKVPRQVVVQRLGTQRLKAAALEELVQDTMEKAIAQEKIEALGNFQLRSSFEDLVEQFQPGQALTFTAAVDVPPEVHLGQYTGLQVTATKTDYDPSQIETLLAEHQSQRATLIPVEGRPAESGDVVLVDFTGRLEPNATGEEPDAAAQEAIAGPAEDFQLELVPGKFLPGFVEGVIGMNLDETREIPVTFPADYFQASLAGLSAIFTVTLKEIKEKELPSLDDEFAQEISEFETLAELRTFLEERYRQEADQKTEASTEAALVEALLQDLEVELPETLITNEVNFLLAQTANRLQEQGLDINRLLTPEVIPEMRQRLRPEAIARIKRTLALAEVAKRESIQVPPEEIEARCQELIQDLSDRKLDRDRLQEVVQEELLQKKVLQWLKDHGQVELVEAEAATAASTAEISASEPEANPGLEVTTTLEATAVAVPEAEPEASVATTESSPEPPTDS